MADSQQSLQALYTAPLASFVTERSRLAAELRTAGKGDAGKELARRRRPTVSAWAVNQLYWHEREAFDALFAAAARLRKGDLKQTGVYREALRVLHRRAVAILRKSPHRPTDAAMRRVMGTLAAVAAAGSFDPDPPGALTADREPPGFEAVDAVPTPEPAKSRGSKPERTAAQSEERAREQAEAKARQAERQRLVAALREAQAAVRDRERAAALLEKELHAAEKAVENARDVVRDLERGLEQLDDTN